MIEFLVSLIQYLVTFRPQITNQSDKTVQTLVLIIVVIASVFALIWVVIAFLSKSGINIKPPTPTI